MPGTSTLSPDNILRFLQLRSAPASVGELAKGLGLKKSDTRPLFKMLSKLKKRRAIEELPGGQYRLPGRKSDREPHSQQLAQPAAAPPLPPRAPCLLRPLAVPPSPPPRPLTRSNSLNPPRLHRARKLRPSTAM